MLFEVADFLDVVFAVHHDDGRLVRLRFFLREERVAHDDDRVARLDEARGRAVQAEDAGAALARDDVRLEARAALVVDDLHALVLEDAGRLHERAVDRDAAHVLEVRLRDFRGVDFGFQKVEDHASSPRMMLSIRRVLPMKTAMARRLCSVTVVVSWSAGYV